MRFHILGLSHTKTTREYSCCAFTQKVRLLCKMLTELGHTAYHYGTEGSNPICTEHVTVLSHNMWDMTHGGRNWEKDGFNVSINTPAHAEFIYRATREITMRAEAQDFLLCSFGHAHSPIARNLPFLIAVESGIGYPNTFAQYRVFESYAWMHYIYGTEKRETSPSFYDTVIPNYLDMDDYPFESEKDDYFIFIGRLSNHLKGANIASDVCKKIGAKLYLAGQGPPGVSPYGEYLGVLSIEERARWVSKARALFCPTYYIEPFGTVNIEAAAYGTPVICTDFGAFTETVKHGVTGFRCRTFAEFVWAAEHVKDIDPRVCREHAENNYSLKSIGQLYDQYFKSLATLYSDPKGWYSEVESTHPLRPASKGLTE